MSHSRTFLATLFTCAALAVPARAELVTYNFDAPRFAFGEQTPLLNRAPNIGDALFRTSFASGSGFPYVIDTFQPNVLFSGQMLYQPTFPDSALTLTFNTPVDFVRLDFAVVFPGRLVLTTSEGTVSLDSMVVGGAFEGGTLTFSSANPFTSLQLQAFEQTGSPTLFAIDNLTLNTSAIPEPSTFALLFVGFVSTGGAMAWRRRSNREHPDTP